MLRILIADDHEIVRSGLRTALESQANWEIVAEAGDGKEAVIKAIETKPDVVVLDYSMPLINGADATRQIRMRLPKTEVLIFTIHDDEVLIEELLSAGARGYVVKSDSREQLIDAIEALAAHKPFFNGKATDALLESFLARARRGEFTLSDREQDMVRLIAEGHTNKEIAKLLNISLGAVETQRSAIIHRLGLLSSAALVSYAVRNNLVEPLSKQINEPEGSETGKVD
jgi:DNA-binding NarL/FixJ family response regulator